METTESLLPSVIPASISLSPKRNHFIEANTVDCTLADMRNEHIIPVFVKDNETLISHVEFIEFNKKLSYDQLK